MNRPAHPYKVAAFREHDILVPFVCSRCGNCCRKFEPVVEWELLPEIARCLGETITAVQNRLLAGQLSHRSGNPTDCCFLDAAKGRCTIYAVRPEPCRQFPPLDGAGAGAVDCPGYREYAGVWTRIVRRAGSISRGRPDARGKRSLSPDILEEILRDLSGVGISETYRRVFRALNG